jgi:small GTP-binding protein
MWASRSHALPCLPLSPPVAAALFVSGGAVACKSCAGSGMRRAKLALEPLSVVFPHSPHPLSAALADERRLLGDLRELLTRRGGPPDHLVRLRQALADLDHLFLLVVAGEFNSGKSALINALLGEPVLAEGVTPTTAALTLLTHGDRSDQIDRTDGLLEIRHPLPLLHDLALVDTPGTNAISRLHESLTREFIPRSDLLLFVTSADRPFTESERAFLEQIRDWGKKIVVVLNKVDLLGSRADVETQLRFIRESAQRLLGLDPPIYPLSVRQARSALGEPESEHKRQLLRESGFEELRDYLETTLDDRQRLRLKLLSALGVGERLADEYRRALVQRLAVLHGDREASEAIERHLVQHADDLGREFEFRLDRLDNLLHDLSQRGQRFFQGSIRLGRVFDLINADKVRSDFEREVVADTPERVEELSQRLIDWLVDQDQRLWQWVSREVHLRNEAAPEAARSRLEQPFAEDRRAVLQTLTRATRDVLRRHDHRREAEQLATSVRDTVAQATLVEAGALGLGAITMAVVGSAAADVTGLLAAGALATLGLYLLPLKRRRLEAQFRERTEQLRETLSSALRREMESSTAQSVARVRAALAPYDRFVRTELERLESDSRELDRLADGFVALRGQIDVAASSDVSARTSNVAGHAT